MAAYPKSRTLAESVAFTGGILLRESDKRTADERRLRGAACQVKNVSDLVPDAARMHDDLVNAAIWAKVEARELDALAWDLSEMPV